MGNALRRWAAAVAVVALGTGTVSGCAEEGGSARAAAESVSQESGAPKASGTAEGFLVAAREAMAAEPGWNFTVQGKESLETLGAGRPKTATYTAEGRWTSRPHVVETDGTIAGGDGKRPVRSYVVDGIGYFREGDGAWEKRSVAKPETAARIEDPMTEVASFKEYVASPADPETDQVRVVRDGDEVRLRVKFGHQALADRNKSRALDKAGREFAPTLAQLREQGVKVQADDIILRHFDEQLVLDAKTHHVRAHTLTFSFALPYQGSEITYTQEVRQVVDAPFGGTIELPDSVR